MFGITFFARAGSTGHVFLFSNDRIVSKGAAYSGYVGPWTTVAVVPTTQQILDFAIKAQTSDRQEVVVNGSIMAALTPEQVVRKFDFTVDRKTGGYTGEWQDAVKSVVVEQVRMAVLLKVTGLDVATARRSQDDVGRAVQTYLDQATLAHQGIIVNSCSIHEIRPRNDEVERAIGAKERERMLSEADRAMSERRQQAAQNDRALKTYEAETALTLEVERGKLIERQAANKLKEAESDAEATRLRLDPLASLPAGHLLGAALMKMAEDGNIGTLNIAPDIMAALNER